MSDQDACGRGRLANVADACKVGRMLGSRVTVGSCSLASAVGDGDRCICLHAAAGLCGTSQPCQTAPACCVRRNVPIWPCLLPAHLTSSQAALHHVHCAASLLSLHVEALTSTLTHSLDPKSASQPTHPLDLPPASRPASQPVSSSGVGGDVQANVNPETHLRPGRHGEWTTVSGLGPKAGPTWGVDVTPPGMKVSTSSSCVRLPCSSACQDLAGF